MQNALQGKTILVFGATGRLGGTVCRVLADQGANIVIHCNRGIEKAEALAETIKKEGVETLIVQGDAVKEDEAAACAKKAFQKFGRIDGAVNLIHRDKEFQPARISDMNWKDWEPHIDAMKAYFHIVKAVLPYMRRQRYGKIVYLSGGLAYRFLEGCAPFSAVKAGLNAFGKTLALEEGENHITVNAVAPGKILTEKKNKGEQWNALEEQQLKNNAMKRFATPEDVANGILMFLLPENDYITGQTMYLAGGEIMPMP